ncbi:YeeE/YedE thiosulfate transporter family protein [Thiolapillus sp.]
MIPVVVIVTAFLVGFAMKYGGLCTYAAALQIVREQRFERLLAFLGAAAWVALVVIPLAWQWPGELRLGSTHHQWGMALTGGMVLGVGAWLNRGCVFGTFVQLTGGNLTYVATLLGLVAGAVAARIALVDQLPVKDQTALAAKPGLWALAGGVLAVAIVMTLVFDPSVRKRRPVSVLLIAMVLGIGGGGLFVTVDGWDFAAVLIQSGYHAWQLVPSGPTALAVYCTLSMVAGGVVAAISQNRFAWKTPGFFPSLSSLAGGALMGVATVIIPGGNDGLLLSGVPALAPHAWLGYLSMLVSMLVLLVMAPNDRGFSIGGQKHSSR